MNTLPVSAIRRFGTALVLGGLLLAATPTLAGNEPTPATKEPQPVNLVLHLLSPEPVSAITLLDGNGAPVYEGAPDGDKIVVEGLMPGLYVAWMKVGKRVLTRRVRVR